MNAYESNRPHRQEDEFVIDLSVLLCDLWKGFKKFWWFFIILCCILAAAGYFVTVARYTPQYESKASFTVSTKTSYEESNTIYSFYYDSATAEQMANLFPYILSSDVLMKTIAEDLGTGSVPGSLNATAVENSNLFTMTAVSSDPSMAQLILKSALEHFPEVSRYVIGETRLNIIQPATYPDEPYNRPGYRRTILKGFAAGMCVSAVLLVLYALTRRTIRREEDFREVLNMTCIGMIPQVKFKVHGKSFNRSVDIHNDKTGRPFTEAVGSLAYKLERQMKQNGWKTLMVTSTVPEEGKSTIAWNVAQSLSEDGKRVLLIDADLRNPSLAKLAGAGKKNAGLLEVMTGKAPTKDAIQKLGPDNVYFMGFSKPVKSSLKLLSSRHFAGYMAVQRKHWDYIIVDTPPCGVMADAAAVAEHSDAVLYIIRQDTAKQWQIMDGIQNVRSCGTPIIGGVLNGIESSLSGYGYNYYGYGYGRYGYGRYGYGRYGYGRYGYGSYGSYGDREKK